jgi:hypothetical protein
LSRSIVTWCNSAVNRSFFLFLAASYTFKPLGHACPARCPVHVLLSRVPLGPSQAGVAQALDREFRQSGIKVTAICPGGVKTEFAIGKGRTEKGVAESEMLDPEDVAGVVVQACTQSPKSRIIEVQMRTMAEALA